MFTWTWIRNLFFPIPKWIWQDRCGTCGYDCSSLVTDEDSHNGFHWETRTCPECGVTNIVEYNRCVADTK